MYDRFCIWCRCGCGGLARKRVVHFLETQFPDWAAQQKTPHHVEGGEGGEGEHHGGSDGGGKGSLSSEVDEEVLIRVSELDQIRREHAEESLQLNVNLKRAAEDLKVANKTKSFE